MRQARGWTQEDLAGRLAVSRVAVSHFEMGQAVPSERTVVLLAGLFCCEPYELVEDTNYPPAKAERLPGVACRYTEVDLQLALMERDLEWAARISVAERQKTTAMWLGRLAALADATADLAEGRRIEAALRTLREQR